MYVFYSVFPSRVVIMATGPLNGQGGPGFHGRAPEKHGSSDGSMNGSIAEIRKMSVARTGRTGVAVQGRTACADGLFSRAQVGRHRSRFLTRRGQNWRQKAGQRCKKKPWIPHQVQRKQEPPWFTLCVELFQSATNL